MTYAVAWWLWDLMRIDRGAYDVRDDALPLAELVWALVMIAGIALTIVVDVVAERARYRRKLDQS